MYLSCDFCFFTIRNDNQSKKKNLYIFNKDEFNSVIYEAKLCQKKKLNEITEQKKNCIIKIQFFY